MFSEEIIDDEFDEEDEINFDTENPNCKQGITLCQHFFLFLPFANIFKIE